MIHNRKIQLWKAHVDSLEKFRHFRKAASGNALSHCLSKWIEHLNCIKQRKNIKRELDSILFRRYFTIWRKSLERNRREKKGKRYNVSTAYRRTFLAWHMYCKRRKSFLMNHKVLPIHYHSSARYCLYTWRRNTTTKMTNRILNDYFILRRCFYAIRSHSDLDRKRLSEISNRYRIIQNNSLIAKRFMSWKLAYKYRPENENEINVQYWKMKKTWKFYFEHWFHCWKLVTSTESIHLRRGVKCLRLRWLIARRNQAREEMASIHCVRSIMNQGMANLRKFTSYRQKMRMRLSFSDSYHADRILHRALMQWKLNSEMIVNAIQASSRAMEYYFDRGLHLFFTQMIKYHRLRIPLKLTANTESFENQMSRSKIKRVFGKWRGHNRQRRRLKSFIIAEVNPRKRTRSLRLAFMILAQNNLQSILRRVRGAQESTKQANDLEKR